MDNLDLLKQKWDSTVVNHPSQAQTQLVDKIKSSRLSSSRQRIAMHCCVSIAICIIAVPLIFIAGSVGLDIPVWFDSLYILYFMAIALMKGILYHRISNLDFMMMPVKDAMRGVLRFKKTKLRFKLISLSLGAVVICTLLYLIARDGDSAAMSGALSGLVIGVVTGFFVDRHQRRLLNELLAELDEMDGK